MFFNGVEVPKCFTADEELGIVEFYATDSKGHVLLEYRAGQQVAAKRIQSGGDVKIVLPVREQATDGG